jgi:hypothetical protein
MVSAVASVPALDVDPTVVDSLAITVVSMGSGVPWCSSCLMFSIADPKCFYRSCIPDPGLFSIPDPGSEFFPTRIRIKEFKYFNPKKWFLSSRKYDSGCSSRIWILDPGVKKAPDPGSGSATLFML